MNKNKETHEFSSTQINWPEPAAHRFTEFAASIPDSDVYFDPDDPSYGREKTPHITVKYGLHTSDPDKVKKVVSGTGPISVEAGEIKIFKSEKYDVIVVKIKSTDLHKLNEKISKHLEVTDTHPTYKPHVTIAYVKPGCGDQYDGDTRFNGISATFNSISLSAKDGKIYQISLKQTDTKFTEALRMTIADLMTKVRELRKKYQEWKQKHPEQESEEMINELLLLKEKLAERGMRLPKQDTPLDLDAEAFGKRVKFMPFVPEPGKVFKFTDSPYAPVHPSGDVQGSPISLSDFESHFRNFLAASPVIWAVGGIVEHDSTVNDCDILCSFPTEEEMQRIVDFRLFRMLPENIAHRASFLHERRGSTSPFTDCLPLYRLKLERIPDAEIIRMSESELSFAEITLRAKGAAKQEREANISMREDRVELGRYFKAMKPYKIAPPGERQSVEAFLDAIKKEGVSPGWFCLPSDQTIICNPETKPIPQLNPENDKVLTASGYFKKVLGKSSRYISEDLIKIKTAANRVVRLTGNHECLAIKGLRCSYTARKAQFCKPDCGSKDWFPRCKEYFKRYEAQWIPAAKLDVGDFLAIPKFKQEGEAGLELSYEIRGQAGGKIKSLQANARVPDYIEASPELYEFCGLYLAEGCCSKGRIILSFGDHETGLHEKTVEFALKVFGLKAYVRQRKQMHTTVITINSAKLSVNFNRIFGKGAKNKRIPAFILNGDKNNIKAFIRGYFLGDGHAAKYTYEFGTASSQIAVQLPLLLSKIGILASTRKNKKEWTKIENKIVKSSVLFHIEITGKQLERMDFLGLKKRGRSNRWFEDENYFWVPILQHNLEHYNGTVWNVETEEGNYVPSIIVKNSSKKFDGFRTTFVIKKGKLTHAFSDDGLDNVKKFPQTAAEAKDLWPDQDLVLDAEVEWIDYKKRQHFPREVASSYLRRKGIFDDSSLCINVFDCVYLNKDIHNSPFSERWDKLKELGFPQSTNACPNKDYRWNLIPHYLGKTIEEIREHTEKVSKAFGSEGNVIKKADSIHTLTGKRIGWIKWHRTSLLYGLVTDVFETKVEGVYNIEWSVDPGSYQISKKNTREVHGKKFLLGGKTFATTLEPKIGKGIIQIELETLNFIHDKRSGTYDITAWAPRFLRIASDRKTPDTVADAVKRAIKNRVYQEKIIKPDGSIEYLPGASAEEFPSKIK